MANNNQDVIYEEIHKILRSTVEKMSNCHLIKENLNNFYNKIKAYLNKTLKQLTITNPNYLYIHEFCKVISIVDDDETSNNKLPIQFLGSILGEIVFAGLNSNEENDIGKCEILIHRKTKDINQPKKTQKVGEFYLDIQDNLYKTTTGDLYCNTRTSTIEIQFLFFLEVINFDLLFLAPSED